MYINQPLGSMLVSILAYPNTSLLTYIAVSGREKHHRAKADNYEQNATMPGI